jgi:signal transduction histidine kinase
VTLRTRLAWTFALTLALVVVLLSAIFATSVDRTLRGTLDGRLKTAAGAIAATVDVHHGLLKMDAEDRVQMLAALGGAMEGGVFTTDGVSYATSSNAIPASIQSAMTDAPAAPRIVSVGSGNRALRVAIVPVARKNTTYGYAVAWTGSEYITDFDRNAIALAALAALVVGVVAALISSAVIRRALVPLERLGALATEIEAHDLSGRLGAKGHDELAKIGSAFDRMLDRLEAAFARQRRFTADASHELRAPLAVIRAEADVTLGKERTTDDYRRALETVVGEVDRLDALVDALLVAARADSARAAFESIDLGAVALLAASRLEPAATARHITLTAQTDEASLLGDAQALERAVAAIVHNAIDFAKTRVDVRVTRSEDGAEVIVTDDGSGFSREALAHALDRFWRGDPGRVRGGTGLGLSIADAIVQAHGGRILLSNAEPHGARVRVVFYSSYRHVGMPPSA